MNAYELADDLQEFYDEFDGSFKSLEKSITMLRQQADKIKNIEQWEKRHLDHIEQLEKEVEHYKNKAEYLDKRELELLAEIAKLEKDLHMVQRHYDQLQLPAGYVVVCVHCAKELNIEFDEPTDLEAKIAKYEEVLQAIANDYHELSDHKIEVQVRNHKKWAKEALK